jgi:hypothetical protein
MEEEKKDEKSKPNEDKRDKEKEKEDTPPHVCSKHLIPEFRRMVRDVKTSDDPLKSTKNRLITVNEMDKILREENIDSHSIHILKNIRKDFYM